MCVSVYEVICIELYIYTHSQILIVISLSRTMQDLRFYPTCSKINLLLFNICWQKTQNSWVRDKGFHCSQPEQESEFPICVSCPKPSQSQIPACAVDCRQQEDTHLGDLLLPRQVGTSLLSEGEIVPHGGFSLQSQPWEISQVESLWAC